MARNHAARVHLSDAEFDKMRTRAQEYALSNSEYLRMLLRADLPLLESRYDAEELAENGELSGDPQVVFVDGYTMNEIAVELRRAVDLFEATSRTLSVLEKACVAGYPLDENKIQIIADATASLDSLNERVEWVYEQFDGVLDRQILQTGR